MALIQGSNVDPRSEQETPKYSRGKHQGQPAIFLSGADSSRLTESLKFALVGKIYRGSLRLDQIRKHFEDEGFKGNMQFGRLTARSVLIRCGSESVFTRIWSKGSRFIGGTRLRVSKWTTRNPHGLDEHFVPVWMKLPNLPVHLFEKDFLFSVGSEFGSPITVDHATSIISRPYTARVCVEIDLRILLPYRIWIGNGEGGFWQQVYFEKIPPFCSRCAKIGHLVGSCKLMEKRRINEEITLSDLNSTIHVSKEKVCLPPTCTATEDEAILDFRSPEIQMERTEILFPLLTPLTPQVQSTKEDLEKSGTSLVKTFPINPVSSANSNSDSSQSQVCCKEYGQSPSTALKKLEKVQDENTGLMDSSLKLMTANGIDEVRHGILECIDTEFALECISTEENDSLMPPISEVEVSSKSVMLVAPGNLPKDKASNNMDEEQSKEIRSSLGGRETETMLSPTMEIATENQESFNNVETPDSALSEISECPEEHDHSTSVTAAAEEPINHLTVKSQGFRLKSHRSNKASVSNRKKMHTSNGPSWRKKHSKNLRKTDLESWHNLLCCKGFAAQKNLQSS